MKQKPITVMKIAFCVLLVVSLVCACLGVRIGRNRLHVELSDVRNADILDRLCDDFDGNADLLDGFSISRESFYDAFVCNAASYYGQKLLVTAQNRTRQDITVLGLRVHPEDEDAYGVYVSSTPLAAVTVPAGTKEPKNIWFYLIDDRDNEEALEILRRAYTLELLYVDASTGYTRLADVPSDVLQAETIRSEGRATAFQTLPHVSSTVASRE